MRSSFFSRFKKEISERFDLNYIFTRRKFERAAIDAFLNSHPLKFNLKFSIVIPTYGIPPIYLKECFQSIEKQTYSNWEVCICNDADPITSSADFVRLKNKRDPDRFKLKVHSENQGICEATRSALELAQGEFVVFMDADDVLHPCALQALAHAIDSADIDFLYSNHDHMTDWGLRIKPMLKPGWSPELLMHVNYINHLTCIRKSLIEDHRDEFFQQFSVGAQDWDLCLKMILHARRVRHIPLILYHWRARPGSMAEHPATKPWAIENQLAVRKRIAPLLGEEVEFDTEKWIYKTPLKNVSDCTFHFQKNENAAEILKRLDSFLANATVQIILFASNDVDSNSLRGLIPYAKLRHVGCVWAHTGPGLRTAYTVASNDHLVPLSAMRSSFSGYSGNVLTGPLNGLAIERNKLDQIMIWIKLNLSSAEIESIASNEDQPNALGAVIGLVSIVLKLRNMSAGAVIFPQQLTPIRLSPALVPGSDSYL